jgi:hypothetical protein
MGLSTKLAVTGLALTAVASAATAALAITPPKTCPAGQKGVIVQTGDTTTSVCTDADKKVVEIIQDSVVMEAPTLPPLPTAWVGR